ncbi:MAG: histone deacetylase [Proteobacteria bacterium]|nr:histone deacetylase [Pseudomonadota bacterium]
MRKTGIVRDKRYLNHRPGSFHPESPERLETIYSMLEEPEAANLFQNVPARRALRDELLLVHSPGYVDMIMATEGKGHRSLDPDTAVSDGSCEAALLAAGGVCEAISRVVSGETDNVFALVRPPGHHAERSRAMGFCIFNNVAVGARYAQEFKGIKRILVVDWDLHHGNGTQHSFEEDPTILYFSTHQYPYYPGSGAYNQIGTGDGEGFTVNVPFSPGHGNGEYRGVFKRVLEPIALEFKPDLVLVSAGFDIYEGDPLGGMHVTPAGFAGLTRSIMDIADQCCGGKLVITLEGGYDLKGLKESVRAVLKELADVSETRHHPLLTGVEQERVDRAVAMVSEVHGRFWKALPVFP